MTCGDKFSKNCPTQGTRVEPTEVAGRAMCNRAGCGKPLVTPDYCVAGHLQFPPTDHIRRQPDYLAIALAQLEHDEEYSRVFISAGFDRCFDQGDYEGHFALRQAQAAYWERRAHQGDLQAYQHAINAYSALREDAGEFWFGTPPDWPLHAQASTRMGDLYREVGALAEADAAYTVAAATWTTIHEPEQAAAAQEQQAQVQAMRGGEQDFPAQFARATTLLRHGQYEQAAALASQLVAPGTARLGTQRWDSNTILAAAQVALGYQAVAQEQPTQATAHFDVAREVGYDGDWARYFEVQHGDEPLWEPYIEALMGRGLLALQQGDLATAQQTLTRGAQQAEELHVTAPFLNAQIRLGQAALKLAQGQELEALLLYQQTADSLWRIGAQFTSQQWPRLSAAHSLFAKLRVGTPNPKLTAGWTRAQDTFHGALRQEAPLTRNTTTRDQEVERL